VSRIWRVTPYERKWRKLYARTFDDRRDAHKYLMYLDRIAIDAFIKEGVL